MGWRLVFMLGAAVLLVSIGQSARADYTAGAKAFRASDYVAALSAWQPLADQGHSRAQFGIGVIYEEGGVGVESDLAKAAAWYREAAEQGLADAQFNLGNLYRTGRGVDKDPRRAVVWYLKAAVQGMPVAQYNLALSYDTGIGAARNQTVAAKWYRSAAKQGDVDAMLGLAALYRHGLGIDRDRESAMAWYRRAAEEGDPRGRLQLDAMAGEAGESPGQEPAGKRLEAKQPEAVQPAPQPAPSAALAEPAPAAEIPPPTAASPPSFGVQLAAYRSRQGATAAWQALRAAHGDLLGTIEPSYRRTPLAEDDGVVYRLVVGRFATRAQAGDLCARFKRRGVDCFVPRPR